MGAVVNRNGVIALSLTGFVAGMIGMSYAAVPLYELFCRVTGYGGTTQVADAVPETVTDRTITVRFNADVVRDMPWRFQPVQREMTLQVGQSGLAFYAATNPTAEPITGTATFNVTPQKAGIYFSKIDCFCFTEQTLTAGQSVEMPVQFFVDPEMIDDPNMDDVNTITLSYTFFRLEETAGGSDDGSVKLAAADSTNTGDLR